MPVHKGGKKTLRIELGAEEGDVTQTTIEDIASAPSTTRPPATDLGLVSAKEHDKSQELVGNL